MKLNIFNASVDTSTFIYGDLTFEYAESLLSSSEGTLGLEWLITRHRVKKYLFSQMEDLELERKPKLMIQTDLKELSCYSLSSYKPICFPFRMQLEENIMSSIIKYTDKTLADEKIIIQIILKKVQGVDWQIDSKLQYHSYISGIELPTKNKVVRSIQHRILEFLQNKEEFFGKNPMIEGAEQKFTEVGYETYIRFAIYGGNKEKRNQLAAKVKLGFSIMNYSNSWIMGIPLNKSRFIRDINLRRTPFVPTQLIMCVSELLPLFSSFDEEEKIEQLMVAPEEIETNENSHVYEIFPRGERVVREDDKNVAQRFNKAFKKLNLIKDTQIKINSIQHGSTVRRINFNLPEGLRLSQLQKSIPDIQTELALSHINIEQGKEPSTVSVVIPQDVREKVFIRDCLENPEFQKFIKNSEIPFIAGIGSDGEIIYDDLTRIRNLLIAGSQGSGKSVFLNCLLVIMMLLRSPKHLQMLLIDPKQVELAGYRKYPHVMDVVTDNKEAFLSLVAMVEKMEDRYTLLAKKGYKNIQQFNKNEKERLPYIVIVIDELADLIMTMPALEKQIILLAQKSRASGIYLIVATQKPLATVVTSLIKGNIPSRVCFTCADGTSYKVALDEVPKMQLLGRGDGLLSFEGIQGLVRFQGALIGRDDDEQDRIIEHLAGYWKGNFKKETLSIDSEAAPEDEDMTKLKRTILESGETRVTVLQKCLGVRSEKVSEMMMSLVDLGWLLKHRSKAKGYEMVLSEDQRKSELAKIK
ncbi:hypothetical protein BC351_00420 [Paenibacillus ferrarius]|uniref:FtsK domain-containing protein n=1 Tax=Paenibacillus ferrarius TaxID=1469647 RepID=A0A1V4HS44_9BACL|nr:FtsK/SpoIIIE domain-containing protein [Paenibacillus ferrarius]OPH61740.1 hypothetical protein BC351_00420 [Paenibacillus ferrarius]